MNGGQQYWNEETQRWEEGTREEARTTPPPPGRPDHAPTLVTSHSGEDVRPPASGPPGTEPPAAAQPSTAAAPPPVPPPPPAPWVTGPSWPPADQPSTATAARFDRRRVWAAVVGAAVVIGVTAGLVLTRTTGDGDDHAGQDQAAESVTPTGPEQPPTPESLTEEVPQETPSPSPTAARPPSGYESFDDPEGFRAAVPAGWGRTTLSSKYGMDIVNYRSPDGRRRIQVFQVAESTPQESFDLFLSPGTPKAASFRELGRQSFGAGGLGAERLEYLVDSIRGEPDIGTWHVVDTRFAASDGTLYAVAVYGRDDDGREDEVAMADAAVSWFCAPVGTCDGA
ncbi:hypothetical protein SZN_02192 [Streptomyces zinciresistens K42]|uniref:Uncharacterized protein n=1 Tax=Streptomyces zinciresistens K42 TaxID=700597 RepID=G2G4N5_9ACTN|nr:hypothetical protein [Streptomyces zinciresistens]EGX61508.1 hypothetical protein SZN_02192 [Streptomyces zinciresistens K42]